MTTRLTALVGVLLALAMMAATSGSLHAQQSTPETAEVAMGDDAAMMQGDTEMTAQMTQMMEQCQQMMQMMSMMMGMMGGEDMEGMQGMAGMEGMEDAPASATPAP